MARTGAKTKKKEDLRQRFNEFLNEIWEGRSFSMDTIKKYEEAALAAREEQRIKSATPRKQSEIGELVFARIEQTKINKHMTENGLQAAFDLARMMELAAGQPRRLKLKEWVKG